MKVAVVGVGYWGKNYVRVCHELGSVECVYVVDPRDNFCQKIVDNFPYIKTAASVDELLNSDVEAFIVSTPASTHFDIAAKLIKAGKNVLLEKPITVTSESGLQLLDLAKSHAVTVMVGHTFIFNNGFRKTLEVAKDREKSGPFHYIYAKRTNLGPIREDVSVIWDLAPHDICMILELSAEFPSWVSATGARSLGGQFEDVGFISLGFSSGLIAHIHVSWIEPHKERQLVIVAGKRRIVFDDMNTVEPVRIFEKGVATSDKSPATRGDQPGYFTTDGDIFSPKVAYGEPLKDQVMHFVECVKNKTEPRASVVKGVDVVKVLEGIDISLKNNGARHNY